MKLFNVILTGILVIILFPAMAIADTETATGKSTKKSDNQKDIIVKYFSEGECEIDLDEIISKIDKDLIASGNRINLVVVQDDGNRKEFVIKDGKIISIVDTKGLSIDIDEITAQIDKDLLEVGKRVTFVVVNDDGSRDYYIIEGGKIISYESSNGITLEGKHYEITLKNKEEDYYAKRDKFVTKKDLSPAQKENIANQKRFKDMSKYHEKLDVDVMELIKGLHEDLMKMDSLGDVKPPFGIKVHTSECSDGKVKIEIEIFNIEDSTEAYVLRSDDTKEKKKKYSFMID